MWWRNKNAATPVHMGREVPWDTHMKTWLLGMECCSKWIWGEKVTHGKCQSLEHTRRPDTHTWIIEFCIIMKWDMSVKMPVTRHCFVWVLPRGSPVECPPVKAHATYPCLNNESHTTHIYIQAWHIQEVKTVQWRVLEWKVTWYNEHRQLSRHTLNEYNEENKMSKCMHTWIMMLLYSSKAFSQNETAVNSCLMAYNLIWRDI